MNRPVTAASTAPTDPVVDHGRATWQWDNRLGSGVVSVRSVLVCLGLVVACLAATAVALRTGFIPLTLGDMVDAVTGGDDADKAMVLLEWRLPRALFALCVGAALAVSGAIFQSLTRNPLGSPDVIGLQSGAYLGAVVMLVTIGATSYYAVALAALVSGILTAVLVYVLAWQGGLSPFRMIIVGIGTSYVLASAASLILLRVDVDRARAAVAWGAGSLADLGYEQLWPMAAALLVLTAPAVLLLTRLRIAELGDDTARAVGLRVDRVRAAAIVVAVGLVAVTTAAVGPIAFVALAAPQIARRLTRGHLLELGPVALTGAAILATCDVVALRTESSTGVVVAVGGGLYLVWLLINENRRRP